MIIVACFKYLSNPSNAWILDTEKIENSDLRSDIESAIHNGMDEILIEWDEMRKLERLGERNFPITVESQINIMEFD